MVRLYAQTVGDGTGSYPSGSPTRRCADAAARLKRSAAKQNFFAGKVKGLFPANDHGSPQPDRAAQSSPEQVPPCCGGYRHPRPRGTSAQTGILRCAWPKVPNECLGRSAAAAAVLPQEGDIVILAGQAILPAAAGVGPVAEQHIPPRTTPRIASTLASTRKICGFVQASSPHGSCTAPPRGAQIPTHILSPSGFRFIGNPALLPRFAVIFRISKF